MHSPEVLCDVGNILLLHYVTGYWLDYSSAPSAFSEYSLMLAIRYTDSEQVASWSLW
jgi:hypothetical protein